MELDHMPLSSRPASLLGCPSPILKLDTKTVSAKKLVLDYIELHLNLNYKC